MSNKVVDNCPHALEFVPECYKNQKKCEKAVDTYPSSIQFVPECLMTHEKCDKAVNRCFLYLIIFLINIKIKKCVTVVSKDPFFIVYCPDKYKTQRMCDEVVDDSLAALRLIPNWFVTSKMIKGCVCYIFASLCCMSKREHLSNKEKCFLFHFESYFRF